MHRRLLVALFAALLLWPSAGSGASPRRAFWYSLLIPGWGQYSAGRPTSGARFLVAELAIWSGYLGLQHLGDVRREHYQTYAAAHAGARPAGKGGEYLDDLGFYASWLQHNQVAQRQDGPAAELYPAIPAYFWEWDRDASRERYRALRNDSKLARRQAVYLTGLVLVNHFAAAVHAARAASADEAPAASATRVGLGPLGTGLGLVMHRDFF